jgi:Domain of unknown function (DUF4157)
VGVSEKLIADLLAMAIRFSNLPGMPTEQLPFFEPLTTAQLEIQVCPYILTACEGIVAAYDHENYVVLYLDTFDPENPEDNSFIVHELVHVLQHHSHIVPKPLTCYDIKILEMQAYATQNAYLRYMGSSSRYGRSESSSACEGPRDK